MIIEFKRLEFHQEDRQFTESATHKARLATVICQHNFLVRLRLGLGLRLRLRLGLRWMDGWDEMDGWMGWMDGMDGMGWMGWDGMGWDGWRV